MTAIVNTASSWASVTLLNFDPQMACARCDQACAVTEKPTAANGNVTTVRCADRFCLSVGRRYPMQHEGKAIHFMEWSRV